MSVMASFKQQAQRFAGRGARNMLAAAGLGLLAATIAVAPSYAQQATPISTKTEILANGTQVTINGKYGSVTAGPNTNCAAFERQYDRSMCVIGKGEALKLQGKQLDAQGHMLDQQLAITEKTNACLRKIKSALDTGVMSRERLGQVTKQNACAIAAGLS